MSPRLNKMRSLFSHFITVLIKVCRASDVDCSESVHSISQPHISLFLVICHIVIFYILPNILNGHFSRDFLPKILSQASVSLYIYTHTHTHTHIQSTPSSIARILFSCGNSELHIYHCQKIFIYYEICN